MISTQLVLFYTISTTYAAQWYNGRFQLEKNADQFPTRLFELMRTYYEDVNLRSQEMNTMRFMYEESPHFEQGYVMHEIIEKYRKMVQLVTRQHQKSTYVLGAMERLREIQKIHFEIYHLVNMMHEIPLKWKDVNEFNDDEQEKHDNTMFLAAQAAFERAERERLREKKKKMRALKKSRLSLLESGDIFNTQRPPAKRVPYNKLWPIDYGWEIDDLPIL